MKIDLSALFKSTELPTKYRNIEEELAAVSDGSKFISSFVFETLDYQSEPFYRRILVASGKFGLLVTAYPRFNDIADPFDSTSEVYVSRPDQAWRVSAILSVLQIVRRYRWDLKSENLESIMLGYSDSDFDEWKEALSATSVRWGSDTIFFWLDREQLLSIENLGRRALPPGAFGGGLSVFLVRGRKAIAPGAFDLIPPGARLARVSVDKPVVRRIFSADLPWGDREFATSQVDDLKELNAALVSRVEILSTSGWS